MRLKSIELINYRCYQDFKVDFGPGFNVIAGINGSGKTSLLKSIRDALAVNVSRLSPSLSSLAHPFIDGDPAYVRGDEVNGRWRFEPQYPVRVIAQAELLNRRFTWSIEHRDASGQESPRESIPFDAITQAAHVSEHITYPLFAFYPTSRAWALAPTNEVAAATRTLPRVAGYEIWWDASANADALQQWSIAKTMERLQFASDSALAWDSVIDDELAITNRALSAVFDDAKGLRYDFAQKSLTIEWIGAKAPTLYKNLSDGERVAIALVSDIARRMCLLNPHLATEVARQTPGVVLIDELDIHLHPTWQRLIVRGLTKAFPMIQFIATSHSPHVLSELRPEHIILLTHDGASRPQASYGLDANRVLAQIMDAGTRPTEVEKSLSELFTLIEQNELSRARSQLEHLKTSIPGLPELAGAEALIRRKEVIGR